MKDTIFALSSAPGKAAVGVIRFSGSQVKKIIEHCFNGSLRPRIAEYKNFYDFFDKKNIIDRVIAIYFPEPNSFTGEDILEIHCHSSQAIIDKIYNVFCRVDNIRIAKPGEFIRYAYANRKFNFLEVEALSDLLESETEVQRQLAISQSEGKFIQKVLVWRDSLLSILSYIEVMVDFSDQDITEDVVKAIEEKIDFNILDINKIITETKKSEIIKQGIKAVILGRPNTGKSTLLNFLTDRDVAIVSSQPGTTRDIIEAHINISGYSVRVWDGAGIHTDTNCLIEQEGMKRLLHRRQEANIEILMTDFENIDKDIEYFSISSKTIVIINKIDLISNASSCLTSELKNKMFHVEHSAQKIIYVSLLTHINEEHIFQSIESFIKDELFLDEQEIIPPYRYMSYLENISNEIQEMKNNLSTITISPEIFAERIRNVLWNIEFLCGKFDLENVYHEIFDNFCIGK